MLTRPRLVGDAAAYHYPEAPDRRTVLRLDAAPGRGRPLFEVRIDDSDTGVSTGVFDLRVGRWQVFPYLGDEERDPKVLRLLAALVRFVPQANLTKEPVA